MVITTLPASGMDYVLANSPFDHEPTGKKREKAKNRRIAKKTGIFCRY